MSATTAGNEWLRWFELKLKRREWERSNPLLAVSLECAVPLRILEHRKTDPEERIKRARELANVVASHGDDILYRSKRRGESAAAFNALAEGIALLAYAPGGVTFLGAHWEA